MPVQINSQELKITNNICFCNVLFICDAWKRDDSSRVFTITGLFSGHLITGLPSQ